MKVAIVNPPLLSQYSDFFSSGIPYFPIGAAYLAASLKRAGHEVVVIDAFGEKPNQIRKHDKHSFVQGLYDEEVMARVPSDVGAICFYASLVTSHPLNLSLVKAFKAKFPKVPAIIFENSQQVYAYSLEELLPDFFGAGFDYVVMGENELRVPELLSQIAANKTKSNKTSPEITVDALAYLDKKGNIVHNPKKGFIRDLDSLAFPAYELFPLQNYWKLRYSHGPFSGPYLPILTSRGCPYGCKYCVIPATNQRLWRMRSAKNVVDEFEYMVKTFGVTDFHFEDLNPTVNKRRMEDMSAEIINRNLHVTWKFSAGTKVETFDEYTLQWMARAGCKYISISPESGSARVLKLMDKPFSHVHAANMVQKMHDMRVKSQACFVLGFPGETDEDLKLTWNYLCQLAKNGLDETSLFIMAPIPGAEKAPDVLGYTAGKTQLSDITFSPEFRTDFKKLQRFRIWLYVNFFLWRAIYHPKKTIKSFWNFLTRRFEIKTEMTVWRALKTRGMPQFLRDVL